MEKKVKKVHFTYPQIASMYIDAQEEWHVAGRASGKSTGVIAPKMEKNAFLMPRSMSGMLSPSYYKLLTQFLPSVRRGLEMLGYNEGVDYFVGTRAPRNWGWDIPYSSPFRWDTTIHFRCGSGIQMMSQDRAGSSSGLSIDGALYIDEWKYIKYDQYQEETLPAMRGNYHRWGHLSSYGQIVGTSDRPRGHQGRKFMERAAHMDRSKIQMILDVQREIFILRSSIRDGGLTTSTVLKYQQQIRRYEVALNELRKGTVYFTEYSAVDNIHTLGLHYFEREKSRLSESEFNISVLNLPIDSVEKGFYPDLDDNKHTYTDYDIGYVESIRDKPEKLEKKDCRHDARLVKNIQLQIGMDYGSSFNCMVVGQLFHDTFSIDNCFYRRHPGKIKHVVEDFCYYYQYRDNKDIIFHYDHTAIGGNARDDYNYYKEVMERFEERGWNVTPNFIGKTPDHHERYLFMGQVLDYEINEPHPTGLPKVMYNADNCEALLLSMKLCGTKQYKNKFEKNKDPERSGYDQAEAPHLSDAQDTLVWGALNSITRSGEFAPAVF